MLFSLALNYLVVKLSKHMTEIIPYTFVQAAGNNELFDSL